MNIEKILIALSIIVVCSSCGVDQKTTQNQNIDSAIIASVPEWSKQAIWYQIFVERFRNGDKNNDPKKEDIKGTFPDFVPESWAITPWGQDWHRPDDYFKDSNLEKKWDNLQLRRYGGDLQGVIEKLDYIKELGITAIYFNPLNDSPSLHKYDSRSWRHIDRNFGPNPKKDIEITESENPIDASTWKFTTADSLFLELIKLCHKNNIKVIMDYSFNHTGTQFWAFLDIQKNGENSKFSDWYNIESFDNLETVENEFSYKGWSGVTIMPELKKDIIGNTEEFPFEGNLHSISAKLHIFNVVKRWLDPNGDGKCDDGVDGFRLDVAAEIPKGFWVDFRKNVKTINPDAYLVGEIWWKSWPDELMIPNQFLKGDMFDAIMNYRWYRPARNFFADAPKPMLTSKFVEELKDKLKGIDEDRLQAMMNLVSSHDAPRVSTSLYNNGVYKYKASAYGNVDYKIHRPDSRTEAIQKMLLIHQFTFIGAPHIWYGYEVGMWGADDPDTRKPMIWDDIEYEDETSHPFDKVRNTNKVEQNVTLLNFYKSLISMRKHERVLIDGELKFLSIDDENKTLSYSRTNAKSTIIVVFNKSEEKQILTVPIETGANYYDILNQESFRVQDNNLVIELEGLSAKILKNK